MISLALMVKKYLKKCDKDRKSKNPKISCDFNKTLVISIICDNFGSNDEKYLKKKNQFRY